MANMSRHHAVLWDLRIAVQQALVPGLHMCELETLGRVNMCAPGHDSLEPISYMRCIQLLTISTRVAVMIMSQTPGHSTTVFSPLPFLQSNWSL